MVSHTPEIHTKRLTIKAATETDLSNLQILWNDGRVMKWVGFPNGLGLDYSQITDGFSRLQADTNAHHFIVRRRGTGFCGELYYEVDKKYRRAALDIKLLPEAQGKGIATEALKAFVRYVFEIEPEIDSVWTEPSEENIAARRLYERCGLIPQSRPADMVPGVSYWELRREA